MTNVSTGQRWLHKKDRHHVVWTVTGVDTKKQLVYLEDTRSGNRKVLNIADLTTDYIRH